MRLHRLEVTAFGPFAGRETVDFDRLSQAGLFLLHGPTGAGKTSVLDAVCFALYGKVPGPRAGTGRLRSDHAAADVSPEVVCEFTIGGRRLEVTRSPEWQRAKKRGAGTVKQNTKVLLRERVSAEWKPLAGGVQEVSDVLKDLLGLDVDQFTKLILLPQGDFAAFLRAGAEERRPLLQKLFGTDRFASVETWLGERRREYDHQMQGARLQTSVLLARAHQARLPDLLAHDDTSALEPEAAAALVGTWAEYATAERRVAHGEVTTADQEYEKARQASAEGEAAEAERVRLAELDDALAALLAGGPEQEERRRASQAAGHAVVLAPLLRDLTAAVGRRDEARPAFDRAAAAIGEGAEPLGEGAAALGGAEKTAAIVQRLEQARGELTTLTGLLETEQLLARLETEQQTAERAIEQAGRRGEQAETAVGELTARLGEATAQRAAAELLAVTADDAQQAQARATEVARDVMQLDKLDARLTPARDDLRSAIDSHQAAVARVQHLRALRLEGMAAELAGSLTGEAPCPVCGSCEHPAPAQAGASRVTGPEQEAADEAEAEAAAAREKARQAVGAFEQRRAGLVAVTGGLDAESAAAALKQARERVRLATEAGEQVKALTEALTELTRRLEWSDRAVKSAAEAVAAGREALAGLEGRRDELALRLARARGADADIRTRHDRVAAAVAADARYVAAASALDEAATQLAGATAAAEKAARAAGFADLGAATAAARPPAARQALLARIREYDAELARVQGLLAEHKPAPAAAPEESGAEAAGDRQLSFDFDAAAVPPAARTIVAAVDVEGLFVVQARARDRYEAARERHSLAARAVVALTSLARELAGHAAATAPLRERFAVLESVSRCAEGTGGDNLLRMRLSSYVLAARLEQVALAASDRLAAMSGGRYALVHSDGPSKGGARSGLGLAVIDGWTGVQRDPATLSGGETFCTSLALALGLADVVQAEAGGTNIETLLVDEGFGTLDEQTLDEVMDVLDGLRSAGRAVGLVSHVADLRHRIPAQLEVVKTRSGSRLIA